MLNWSRASDVSAVSREVPMSKELLTFIIEEQRFDKSVYTRGLMININDTIASVTVHFFFGIFLWPGFHVSEVPHDFVLQLKTWIVSKGILNSLDPWHGKCLVFLSHEPV